jgi:hypothetical protein
MTQQRDRGQCYKSSETETSGRVYDLRSVSAIRKMLTCIFILIVIISANLMLNHCFYNGKSINPPHPGKGVDSTLPGSYPLTRPGWVVLAAASTPASITACFTTIKWQSIAQTCGVVTFANNARPLPVKSLTFPMPDSSELRVLNPSGACRHGSGVGTGSSTFTLNRDSTPGRTDCGFLNSPHCNA